VTLHSDLQIGDFIGEGHFGKVYEATDPVKGEVAVKVLVQRPQETDGQWQQRKANLLLEGRHLTQATHKNVVHVHHALQSPSSDAVLLVMEYCKGGSLQNAYEKGPLSLAEVLKVATDVSLGLEALHARGMLHRDIKPGNLLRDGAGCTKLGDFGLVTDNIILGYGSQAGYLDHLAPEVWAGDGTSVRTDIWALGVTIFRLLHGAIFYSQITDPQAAVKAGGFAASLPWLPHIPKKWRTFIRRMLSDDGTKRFQSANQVLTALARLPTAPSVQCTVKKAATSWKHTANKRKTYVEWTAVGPRQHEWKAWSEPVGLGNRRKLGGSTAPQNRLKTEKELQAFFAKQFKS
jgi:eukaryotic-like serine/threonine-protein kinase